MSKNSGECCYLCEKVTDGMTSTKFSAVEQQQACSLVRQDVVLVDVSLRYTNSAVEYLRTTGGMLKRVDNGATRSCHSACCCRSRRCVRLRLVDKRSIN